MFSYLGSFLDNSKKLNDISGDISGDITQHMNVKSTKIPTSIKVVINDVSILDKGLLEGLSLSSNAKACGVDDWEMLLKMHKDEPSYIMRMFKHSLKKIENIKDNSELFHSLLELIEESIFQGKAGRITPLEFFELNRRAEILCFNRNGFHQQFSLSSGNNWGMLKYGIFKKTFQKTFQNEKKFTIKVYKNNINKESICDLSFDIKHKNEIIKKLYEHVTKTKKYSITDENLLICIDGKKIYCRTKISFLFMHFINIISKGIL